MDNPVRVSTQQGSLDDHDNRASLLCHRINYYNKTFYVTGTSSVRFNSKNIINFNKSCEQPLKMFWFELIKSYFCQTWFHRWLLLGLEGQNTSYLTYCSNFVPFYPFIIYTKLSPALLNSLTLSLSVCLFPSKSFFFFVSFSFFLFIFFYD